jgi:hypothetical protein
MTGTSPELGRAVQDALDWLGATPETASVVLGINVRTLNAMCQGIVPMRSLVIKFATAIARQCERQPGAPEWWTDIDAWLKLAGHLPRRDTEARFQARPEPPPRPAADVQAPPPALRLAETPPGPPEPLAREFSSTTRSTSARSAPAASPTSSGSWTARTAGSTGSTTGRTSITRPAPPK